MVGGKRRGSADHCEHPLHLGRRVRIAACLRLGDPETKHFGRTLELARLEIRLAELLVGSHLILGAVGDQRKQPLASFFSIAFPEALKRKPITQERVGRIVGQAGLELLSAERFFRHDDPTGSRAPNAVASVTGASSDPANQANGGVPPVSIEAAPRFAVLNSENESVAYG